MRTNYPWISVRLIILALFAISLTTFPCGVALAQAPEPQKPSEVQQLKDRVTQLEQTVEELKTVLKSAAEQKKSDAATGEKVAVAATLAATAPGTTAKPASDEPKGE